MSDKQSWLGMKLADAINRSDTLETKNVVVAKSKTQTRSKPPLLDSLDKDGYEFRIFKINKQICEKTMNAVLRVEQSATSKNRFDPSSVYEKCKRHEKNSVQRHFP